MRHTGRPSRHLLCVAGLLPLLLSLPVQAEAPGGPRAPALPDSRAAGTVPVVGDAFVFGPGGIRLAGAEVTVLEHPELKTTTDANGHYALNGFVPGEPVTLIVRAPDYKSTQTATLTVDDAGLEQVSLQLPSMTMFRYIEVTLRVKADPRKCQIASTVTRIGASLYGPDPTHGEAGAQVTITPPVAPESGPIYFNQVSATVVVPDPRLTETSEDGGVLFVNVPPGTYTLNASKEGLSFLPVTIQCRPGLLVNGSPPYGLQAY